MTHRYPHSRGIQLAGDAQGVVFVEFILAFVPVFVVFLGIVQLSLLSVASLVVQHSAVAGARAASVVLDDDPQFYASTPRGDMSSQGTTADRTFESSIATRIDGDTPTGGAVELGGPRLAAIRRAVYLPLAAITPEPALASQLLLPFADPSLRAVLGTLPASRLLFGLTTYLPVTTAVAFPVAPGSDKLLETMPKDAKSVTVRVTHLVPCVVPLVSALMCKALRQSTQSSAAPEDSRARARAELRLAPGAAFQVAFTFTRVALLQAEATMPLQSASYLYRSQRKGGAS